MSRRDKVRVLKERLIYRMIRSIPVGHLRHRIIYLRYSVWHTDRNGLRYWRNRPILKGENPFGL